MNHCKQCGYSIPIKQIRESCDLVHVGDLIDMQGVADLCGITYATVRQYSSWDQTPKLPQPHIYLAGSPLWDKRDILEWRENMNVSVDE